MALHACPMDPRDNHVTQRTAARAARAQMYQERGDVIRREAKLSLEGAIEAIAMIYGPEALQVMEEMDRLGDMYGPASVAVTLDRVRIRRDA